MSTSRPDAVPSLPPFDFSRSNGSDWNPSFHTIEDIPFLVRTVRPQDLGPLSEVLASSFHAQEGWMRWFYPLLKAGIHEDLKSRLLTRGSHYACLAAVRPAVQERAPSLGRVGQIAQSPQAAMGLATTRSDTILGTVEIALKAPPLLQPWSTKYVYLSNLAVKAECRRQGVAQQLLYTCERVALDWGFSDLYLHVLENNHKARRLYRKAGYRLHRIDLNPLNLLLGQPRQLFLHKSLK